MHNFDKPFDKKYLTQMLEEAGGLLQVLASSRNCAYRNRCYHGIKIGTKPQVFNSSNITQMLKIHVHVNMHLLKKGCRLIDERTATFTFFSLCM